MGVYVVKFNIGDGPRWTANRLTIHPADNADQRLSRWEQLQNIGAFAIKCGPINFDKANIISAQVKAQLTQPGTVQPNRLIRYSLFTFIEAYNRRVLIQVR